MRVATVTKTNWQREYLATGIGIGLSSTALHLLQSRYLRSRGDGTHESPGELFRRVARAVAQAELAWATPQVAALWEERFFKLLCELKFLPNSPTLMNAGTAAHQLSACFVLPIEDSLESILSTLKLSALIQQSGGGTGFNFSKLREKGAPLQSTSGLSSGPVSFLKIFDAVTDHIRQGGKRRGANMGILNVDHPDILEFIQSKSEQHQLRNFNLSVGIRDAFMDAVARNGVWNLVHPGSGTVAQTVNARDLWNAITDSAWQGGDPGLIFLDAINQVNPTPASGLIDATNPCGEVPLLPFESCNLASINLIRFVSPENHSFQWEDLGKTVAEVIRFLDDVIEVNRYLSPDIEAVARGNRKIGLGVMGWAEALSLLEIPYDSEQAVQLGGQLMHYISYQSRNASRQLADERGAFKNWPSSIYYPGLPLRHAACNSIAPTGSISVIANTSSSIEPFFALASRRRHVLENETWQEINPVLIHFLSAHHLDKADVMASIRETGTLQNVPNLPPGVSDIFKTALEIAPNWHLEHQLAFQKFTDNAVSKTINLPETATRADISHVYERAWKSRLKGITVYRYNSRSEQVLYQGFSSGLRGCNVCSR